MATTLKSAKSKVSARCALIKKAAAQVPTNWLDPLLTGPDAVLKDMPCGCPEIEALLNAVRNRILRMK